MKKRSVQRAYQNIRPDEETKARMLQNILLSSEIPPAGKDERKMRKKMKPLVIAAVIGLMIVLMGCAVYVLGLQNLKIGERTTYGEILDSSGNVLKEQELTGDVISLHGFMNSPAYLAHQEWFEFYEVYSKNHVITEEENFHIPPEEYEAYTAYNQELRDKIDEIAGKYGLKLLGAFAPFQTSERKVFYEATGLDSLLIPNSAATISREGGYFYAGGNFKVEFHMTMQDSEDHWPHDMLNTIYYSKADYFDTIYFVIWDWEDWDQWNYTTTSGAELLIAKQKSGYGAKIFCNREDALIYVSIDGYHEDGNGNVTFMTKRQLENVAEQIDYALKVETVDMELAKEKLQKFNNTAFLEECITEYSGFDEFIQERISELGMGASDEYFSLTDINNDGTDDLIVGSTEEIAYVWMMKYGQMNRVMEYGENYKKLKEAWPTMEKKPITVYSENKDKYGYQRYIDEVLSMEHPENTLYVLEDINNDGTQELLIGDMQMLSFVFRVNYSKSGYPNIGVLSGSMTDEELNELKTAWPNMERKPVTEYYSE